MPDHQVDPQLLEILACPLCHAPLHEIGVELACSNHACALRYPVRGGIPILLVSGARRMPASVSESRPAD